MKRVIVFLSFSIFLLFYISSVALAQESQYQFQDKPSPSANVIITSFKRVGKSTSARLVGRVFNRGEATAKNVVVLYQVRNPHGSVMVRGKIDQDRTRAANGEKSCCR